MYKYQHNISILSILHYYDEIDEIVGNNTLNQTNFPLISVRVKNRSRY